jgi:hypothetical protein
MQRLGQLLPWLAFAALAACALHLCWPSAAAGDDTGEAATVSASSLVHWKDAGHDWLLVVDQATRELVVYDAYDGRPLRRLGAANGAGAIDSIASVGNRLMATDQQHSHTRVLSLPELQPAKLAAR